MYLCGLFNRAKRPCLIRQSGVIFGCAVSQEILITGLYAVKLTELKHLPWTQVHPAIKTDGRALCVGMGAVLVFAVTAEKRYVTSAIERLEQTPAPMAKVPLMA